MATKEDILEQLVEEYLLHDGYFVRHNVKFLPRRDHPDFDGRQDSNHSDIDVIGFHPHRDGASRIKVVSCKSWQSGFNPTTEIQAIEQNRTVRGRDAWRTYRELVSPKWSEAFHAAVYAATGQKAFTYVTAVTVVKGAKQLWEAHPRFVAAMEGNPIQLLDLRQMVDSIYPSLNTTLAGTEVGRMLQLFKAAKILVSDSGRVP